MMGGKRIFAPDSCTLQIADWGDFVVQIATSPAASHNPGHEADIIQTEVERALPMRLREEV
jgi:hypothetical protein